MGFIYFDNLLENVLLKHRTQFILNLMDFCNPGEEKIVCVLPMGVNFCSVPFLSPISTLAQILIYFTLDQNREYPGVIFVIEQKKHYRKLIYRFIGKHCCT